MKKIISTLVLICLCNPAFSAPILPIEFEGQPQILFKDLNTDACGVRFLGAQSPEIFDKSAKVFIPDASFMIYRQGVGMVKAVLLETTMGGMIKESKIMTFKTFWMKANNHPQTAPTSGMAVDGENKGSKIYISSLDSVLSVLVGLMSGEKIKLGYVFEDEAKNLIVSGKVTLSDSERQEVMNCLEELKVLGK